MFIHNARFFEGSLGFSQGNPKHLCQGVGTLFNFKKGHVIFACHNLESTASQNQGRFGHAGSQHKAFVGGFSSRLCVVAVE